MNPDDDYVLAQGKTTSLLHIVGKHGGPASALIRGSDRYEEGVHRRSLCGSITTFQNADAPKDGGGRDDYCFKCARTAFARGVVSDPAPYDPDDLKTATAPTDGGDR
ncbi:hypothetical protein [Natronoglomus mannanivorans]|uniref:Uncharacterized protein n=1 Tax=Natronoglomus mannanivorans TaxID=2979990 RepID=A0AAP2Z2K2_9EURY|nr:hypothetical protein [Halobacteria archaeon AArc-xg1-1]